MELPLISDKSSPLLARFKEFYFELIRLKRLVSEPGTPGQVSPAPATIVPGEAPEGASATDALALDVWQRLLTLLERQSLSVGDRSGVFGLEVYREAQYVMAALADEIFLNIDWPGGDFWSTHLLESRLFKTHVAGEMFFKKLDRLLQERDPVYADLAMIYFLALALGFKGRYRDVPDSRQLDFYRHQTFAFVYRDDPRLLDQSGYLFPGAYAQTLDERPKGSAVEKRDH